MRTFLLIAGLVLWLTHTGCEKPPAVPAETLKAVFFDVGQGDAALMAFSSESRLLVDAGPAGGGIDTLLLNRNVSALQGVVLTHPHQDHYGGLRAVLGVASVGRLFLPASTPGSPEYEALLRFAVDTAGVETTHLAAGRSFSGFGDDSVVCLWPPETTSACYGDSLNARSVVLEIRLGRARVFLAGDLPACGETTLLEWDWLRPVDVLKAGHHGSATSTSAALLKFLAPAAVVISSGRDNDYGHPAAETLERLNRSGARVFRTDRAGTVSIWLDGEGGISSDREAE